MKHRIKMGVWLLGVFLTVAVGSFVRAAESNFAGGGDPVVGQEWRVQLLLNTPTQKINTLGGTIQFPTDLLEVVDVNDSRSIINLWVQSPQVRTSTIVFAGITPGGFQGEKGEIITVTFKVKKSGRGAIRVVSPEAYLNDGKGTAAAWQPHELTFTAAATGKVAPAEASDTTPPEPFTVTLGRSDNLFANQWFIAFAAQDKGTGVAYYEVQESTTNKPQVDRWVQTASPYVLQDQELKSTVFVRAIDKKGNSQVAIFVPPAPAATRYQKYVFWGILAVLLISSLFLWYRRRRQRP